MDPFTVPSIPDSLGCDQHRVEVCDRIRQRAIAHGAALLTVTGVA